MQCFCIRRGFVFCFLILGVANTAYSDSSGFWIGVNPHFRISEKRRLDLQAEYRKQGKVDQTMVRLPFVYQLQNKVWLGSGLDLFFLSTFESRIWQQLTYSMNVASLQMGFRFREEFRRWSGISQSGFRSRARVDVTPDWPIRLFRLSLFEEVFFASWTASGKYNPYDRNWLGVQLNFPLEDYSVNVGVMWENAYKNQNGLVALLSLQVL